MISLATITNLGVDVILDLALHPTKADSRFSLIGPNGSKSPRRPQSTSTATLKTSCCALFKFHNIENGNQMVLLYELNLHLSIHCDHVGKSAEGLNVSGILVKRFDLRGLILGYGGSPVFLVPSLIRFCYSML